MGQTIDFRPLGGKHKCDNCGRIFDGDQVQPIVDFFARVEPGGIVPSGVCPDCGALCYPIKKGGDNEDHVSGGGMHKKCGDSRAACDCSNGCSQEGGLHTPDDS